MLSRKKFIRQKENFVCEVCGTRVTGSGYTDHCPLCLWSKHLDVFPGDRKAQCGGLMEPIRVHKKSGEWKIIYCCKICGYQRQNKASANDNFAKIIELSTRH